MHDLPVLCAVSRQHFMTVYLISDDLLNRQSTQTDASFKTATVTLSKSMQEICCIFNLKERD